MKFKTKKLLGAILTYMLLSVVYVSLVDYFYLGTLLSFILGLTIVVITLQVYELIGSGLFKSKGGIGS